MKKIIVPKGFLPIPGYAGYFCRKDGAVGSTKKDGCFLIRKHRIDSRGYPLIDIMIPNERGRPMAVHKLVMLTFVGPRPAGSQVRHLDGDRSNPSLKNLKYGTFQENVEDRRRHGGDEAISYANRGQNHRDAILKEWQAQMILDRRIEFKDIPRRFRVTIGIEAFRGIRNGHKWKHLKRH